jgi:ATP-dependent Zn protease
MSDKKNLSKKPKLSPYWIYGFIIVIFLVINIFSGGMGSASGSATTQDKFFDYLRKGEVEKVLIINRREAQVFLTKEAASSSEHRNSVKPQLLPVSGKSPNYEFQLGDLQNFENTLRQIKADNELTTIVDYKLEENVWGDFLLTLLPFALIIGVWIFIMKRMSSGGGGGAGGQIFNIGKSKAKLFDENTEVKTSFKDVAG